MKFMKLHREVFDLQVSGQLSGVALHLYQYLGFHADCRHRVGTGEVKALSVSKTADMLGCHRYTLNRAVQVLTDLGLFEPNPEGDNCLAGTLPLLAAPAPDTESESARNAPAPAPRVTPETENRIAMAAAAAKNRADAARAIAEAAAQSAQKNGTGSDDVRSRIKALRGDI